MNNQRVLAGPDYPTAAGNCLPIGKFSAKFVDFLVLMGLKLKRLHIIGMSLGGQIAGITGKYVRTGRVHRITGKVNLQFFRFMYEFLFTSSQVYPRKEALSQSLLTQFP